MSRCRHAFVATCWALGRCSTDPSGATTVAGSVVGDGDAAVLKESIQLGSGNTCQNVASLSEHLRCVQAHCEEDIVRVANANAIMSLTQPLATLRLCGVIVLKQLIPLEALEAVHTAQVRHGQEAADSDFALRGHFRREARLPPRPPFTSGQVTAQPALLTLTSLATGGRPELDTFSYIESLPGSIDQNWHVDAPVPERQQPPGIVAVLPLVPVNESNGATEFLLGSHVGEARVWEHRDQPALQLSAEPGDAVLFDARVRHRGRANVAGARPVIYASFVRSWFQDNVNFVERQSKHSATLRKEMQHLFSRLDRRSYARKLEEALQRHGADLNGLGCHALSRAASGLR